MGIQATGQAETAGTVALAYAAHKAASPIRFPPTVALTPFVANAIVSQCLCISALLMCSLVVGLGFVAGLKPLISIFHRSRFVRRMDGF